MSKAYCLYGLTAGDSEVAVEKGGGFPAPSSGSSVIFTRVGFLHCFLKEFVFLTVSFALHRCVPSVQGVTHSHSFRFCPGTLPTAHQIEFMEAAT